MGPLAAAPGSLSYSRASRGSSGPTGTHVQAPGHLGGFPGEAPSRGEGAWVGRAWRGRCPGSPTRAAAFRREPPHAPPRSRIPGTVTCGRGRPVRRTPLPPALLNSHRRGSRQSGSLHPPPHQGCVGDCRPGRQGGGKERAVSRGRGAAPRGGWAVPTCAHGRAPAPMHAGGSPASRVPPPAPLFPLARPKTTQPRRRNPPVPKRPRKRQGSASE